MYFLNFWRKSIVVHTLHAWQDRNLPDPVKWPWCRLKNMTSKLLLSIVHVLNKDECLETTFIQQRYWTSQLASLLKLLWYLFCVVDKYECQNELIFSQPSNIRFQILLGPLSNLRSPECIYVYIIILFWSPGNCWWWLRNFVQELLITCMHPLI